MDDFELEIKNTFIEEATLNLEEVEGCFMELESAADPKPLLDQIFRLAHSLKGGSRSVGFGDVAEFTHKLESLVLALQKGQVQLKTEVVSTLLKANDRLVEMIAGLKQDMAATFNNKDMVDEMARWLESKDSAPAPAISEPENSPPPVVQEELSAPTNDMPPSAAEFFAGDVVVESKEPSAAPPVSTPATTDPTPVVVETKPQASTPTPPAPAPRQSQKSEKDDEVVRVNLSRIELLNDYVGELIVLQSVIQQQVSTNQFGKLQASIHQMAKLSKDVQNLSMGLRMLPVKPLIQKLQRVVRDTSTTLEKKVQLELSGDQLDVDKSVLDQIADPLVHILRNAVDHGVESTAERLKTGKSEVGRVHLSFYNEGNHLIIEIIDDGKGIDTNIIRKKAIEKNLVKVSETLTDKQIYNLIFHPGFSTKEVTTEVSGRGVGMDVVKTNVEKMGGQIEITSEVGKGSKFRLKIPLSLAVIEGLITITGRNRYVIPLGQVQETINLRAVQIQKNKLGIGNCMTLRGQVVPIYRLENLIEPKSETNAENTDSTALLFNVSEKPVAVSVQDLLHSQQVVIKPFGNGLKAQTGWIGSCVLGDGLPTLIINPIDILEGKIANTFVEGVRGGVA